MCSACTRIRLITPAVAAVDIDWEMTDAVNPRWLIVVMHNAPLKGYPAN